MTFIFTLIFLTASIAFGHFVGGFFKAAAEHLEWPEWAVTLAWIIGYVIPYAALRSLFQ